MKKHMDVETLKKMAADAEVRLVGGEWGGGGGARVAAPRSLIRHPPHPRRHLQERARKKDEELTALQAEMEKRRVEVESHSADMQTAIAERAAALQGVDAEMAAGGDASSLLDQKLRLEREKAALEKSVKELTESSRIMRHDLDSTEEMRRKLQDQFETLSAEDTDLLKERQMRQRQLPASPARPPPPPPPPPRALASGCRAAGHSRRRARACSTRRARTSSSAASA